MGVSNTMPLDLYIMYDAVCSYIRTRGHEKYTPQEMHATKTCLKGHRQTLVEFAENLGSHTCWTNKLMTWWPSTTGTTSSLLTNTAGVPITQRGGFRSWIQIVIFT